ncbi:hypothetical protein [Pedobacter insulae]|nr:hypothetical protein [Pedobacter insulae]
MLLIKVFCVVFFCINPLYAQTSKEAQPNGSPIDRVEALFKTAIKQHSRLYNGPSFQNYGANVIGSPNFQDQTAFVNGYVKYDGVGFDDIPLMYNIYEDKVITLYGKYAMFSLISEKVSDFYINNHHFKYIDVTDTTRSIIKPGFFDYIFDGNIKIFVKRYKKQQIGLKDKEVTYYFMPKTNYYIEKEGKYYAIESENSFLNLFPDKKNELKKYLKEHKIKFKQKPEEAMVVLATYYESLHN